MLIAMSIIKIKSIIKVLDFINKDTLMLWDIDNTIMQPIDIAGSDSWFSYRFSEIQKKEKDKNIAISQLLDEQYLSWQENKFTPIEDSSVAVVCATQEIAKHTISVTARGILCCYNTIHWLRKLGISLMDKKFTNCIIPTEKKDRYDNLFFSGHPGFAHGIMFCGGMDEGMLIEKLFKIYPDLKSNDIVFVNDTKSRLEEVQRYCLKNNIKYTGLHYTYGKPRDAKFVKTMKEIEKVRKEVFD